MTIVIGDAPEALRLTPLDRLHRRLGAKMVPFAGYSMPVQYPAGVLAEHLHCRDAAVLFDVSHMGQAFLTGAPGAPAAALERFVPGDIAGLKPGRQRYTLLMNDAGGIVDDLMVATVTPERLFIVANAARKDIDFATIAAGLPDGVTLDLLENRALLALQGPRAATTLATLVPEVAALPFMGFAAITLDGAACFVSRSGYTGEDGFEISIPADAAERVANVLLAQPGVLPAGLGARDSLRLEAGLCLYGADIDELTSPIEAGLGWVIGKRRRVAWDFPGAVVVRDHLDNGVTRLRVGLRPDGRTPARAGTDIVAGDGTAAGSVTSGGFSPSLKAPIAMGYVRRDLAIDGGAVFLLVRGKPLPATIVPMPFVPHRYHR